MAAPITTICNYFAISAEHVLVKAFASGWLNVRCETFKPTEGILVVMCDKKNTNKLLYRAQAAQ